MLVFGPFSADSFFGSDEYKKYDLVVASYHDQGLIPFKTLSFGMGVNYTSGLDRSGHLLTMEQHIQLLEKELRLEIHFFVQFILQLIFTDEERFTTSFQK